MQKPQTQSFSHFAYLCGVYFKAFDGAVEVCGAVALLSVSNPYIRRLVRMATRDELNEEPNDFLATHLVKASEHFSGHSQHFAAFYLLCHGLVKLLLVVGLLRRLRFSYPVAVVTLSLLVAYQVYRLSIHFSYVLGVFTAIDVVVIAAIWHEWRHPHENSA